MQKSCVNTIFCIWHQKNEDFEGMKDMNKKVMISCYLPILPGIFLVEEMGLGQFMASLISVIVGIIIMIKAQDMKEFRRLSLHQFFGIMLADILSAMLFVIRFNNHILSVLALIAFIIMGAVVFLIQFVIDYLISKSFKRNRK